MFNFFKRAKKEPERGRDERRTKESPKGQTHEWQTIKAGEGPIKNTANSESALEENVQSVPNHTSSLASSELREICAVGGVTGQKEISEKPGFPEGGDDVKKVMDQVPSTMLSYAGAVKIPEPRHNVKPCGHGTLAIAPRAPLPGSKRENTSTPPASPKLEIKKFKERSNTTPELYRLSEKLENTDPNKNNTLITTGPGFSPKAAKKKIQEEKEKNLINQEAKFQSELNDLTKQLALRDAEANKLRFQMEELQRDVFAKSAGMDRLQTELQAANKESEMTKTRIRHLDAELSKFRESNSRLTETLEVKTEEFMEAENKTKSKIEELQEVIRQLKTKINWLEQQIESLKQEKAALVKQHEQMKADKIEEDQRNKEALEQAMRQKNEVEAKWKQDFEKLRTINIMKEQDLLDDFEWKLREVQQSCKKRLEEKDRSMEERLLKAYKHAEQKMKEAEEVIEQLSSLKKYESEVVKLRGLTEEQAQSLQDMKEKQEQMKNAEVNLKTEAERLRKMIETEKENIQHVQRLHRQEIYDKERNLQKTLDEKRLEIAKYWEDKLLHEIGRLKDELEQIYTEEQNGAVQRVRDEKEREFDMAKKEWDLKVRECSKEIEFLRRTIEEKDSFFQEETERQQTKTDQDILDLRRIMDKIDMNHHERYEKLIIEHDKEMENINRETEQRIREVEFGWQQQVTILRKTLETMKEEMEQESQHKIAMLIEKHRSELDEQWENLRKQKQDAVDLVENEYVSKYKALEENFLTQQKSHEQREIELLKTVDSLKNELESKNSIIEDLQNNVDTLEGGIQVLNEEIAQQCEDLNRAREEAKSRIKHFQDYSDNARKENDNVKEELKQQIAQAQAKDKETIEKMQMRYNCLEKLFNEVRQRYENRESRQEDLNTIADLRRMIAEQEKDIACMNEEKRYFQMQCMILEAKLDVNISEEEVFQDADHGNANFRQANNNTNGENSSFNGAFTMITNSMNGSKLSIPPTIQECDDVDE